MPSADCLAAIADIAADPLQVVVLFVSSGFRRNSCSGHDNPNTPRMLFNRFSLFRRCFPQSRRLSRGTPMLLSMRNCQVYEKRHLDNWRTYSCVAFSSLFSRLYLPTGGQFLSRLLCTISPHICVRLPSTRSYETNLCHAATLRRYLPVTGLTP